MKTILRKSEDEDFDADTLHAIIRAHDNADGHPVKLDIYAFTGRDGVPVVQIDTDGEVDRFRINVNDGAIWDQDTETPTPLESIHQLLDGTAWSPDTLDAIAEVITSTGR